MAYTTEMVRFPNGPAKPVAVRKLYGTVATIDEAVLKGQHQISISPLDTVPIGFRVLDERGGTVKVWQIGVVSQFEI